MYEEDGRISPAKISDISENFNVVRVLLLERGILAKTHKGVHVKFAEEYIKTGLFPQRHNTILARGWRLREKGD